MVILKNDIIFFKKNDLKWKVGEVYVLVRFDLLV